MPQALAWHLQGSTASRAAGASLRSPPRPHGGPLVDFHSEAHISLSDMPKLLPNSSKLLIWGNEKWEREGLAEVYTRACADRRGEERRELEKATCLHARHLSLPPLDQH